MEFLNPTYVPLNMKTISQINVCIYDDAGTLISFLYGKTKNDKYICIAQN